MVVEPIVGLLVNWSVRTCGVYLSMVAAKHARQGILPSVEVGLTVNRFFPHHTDYRVHYPSATWS